MKRKSGEYPTSNSPGASRKKKTYDKDLVNESLYEVLAYYVPGEARTVGSRTTYTCPECRKPKLDASGVHMKAGCWNAGCPVPRFADALGLIAHFESLDASRQFREVLKKGYEITGLEPEAPDKRVRASYDSADPSGSSGKPSPIAQASAATPAWATPTGSAGGSAVSPSSLGKKPVGEVPSKEREEAPEGRLPEDRSRLRAAVYRRVMDYCKLEERDRTFFRGRGLVDESIEKGGFGSISFTRAQALKATLLDEFGPEDLLQVPGFSVKDMGELKFTLTGDYALIPYHDASGRITTIEGRWTGDGPAPREMGKYVTLLGAGNHLYVFPGCLAGEIEAFCEGPVGAMVAAQSGVTVGAIQGFRRYRASSGSAHDGEYGEPLAELGGVDFSGRLIPYIPDVDDPPQPEVSETAPEAARWLVERRGGRAALLSLPEGKDLDEWLLKYEPEERRRRFEELLARAIPLARSPSEESVNTAVAATRPSSGGEPGGEPRPDTASEDVAEVVEGSAEKEEREDHSLVGADLDDDELRDRVYRAFLGAFPLSDRHQKLLMQWKVSKKTTVQAGLSSLLPARVQELRGGILAMFERSALERVPGFRSSSGALTLPFEEPTEELIVFPYKDAAGRITALEGVRLSRGLAGEERYVSPDGEARLYLPPGVRAGEMELLCGGVLSALNLAEAGIRAAALRGLDSLESSRAGGQESVREAPFLDLGGRPVGVFENREDSDSLSAVVEGLGGYPVAVKLPEHVESVERWIISLPGNKERSQILGRLVEPARSAPTRPVETSASEEKEAAVGEPGNESPATAETDGLQQDSLFEADSEPEERGQSANPEDERSASPNGIQSDIGTTDDPQGSASNGGDSNGGDSNGGDSNGGDSSGGEAAAQEEMRRIESLPALHGEGWLEVRFEDIPKIVARDRPVAQEEDGRTGGGLEETERSSRDPQQEARRTPSRPRPAKHDLQLGGAVGMMCATAGALACVLMLFALNWPLGLAGSSLSALCCGVAAGLLFGVGAALGSSNRRPKSAANSSVYNSAADAWSRSWSQAAFAFCATYLLLTLCHHVAHLLVYPLAGGAGQGPGADLLASVAVFTGDVLDGIAPSRVVEVAPVVALAGAIAIFVRVWEVRKRGPGETVVQVAGGSYTLPPQSFLTFLEGVAAVVVFAVAGRLSYLLFTVFAGSFDGGIGGDVVQSLADGKLVLASCLLGIGVAAYGWLGSKERRRVKREHRLGTLREH